MLLLFHCPNDAWQGAGTGKLARGSRIGVEVSAGQNQNQNQHRQRGAIAVPSGTTCRAVFLAAAPLLHWLTLRVPPTPAILRRWVGGAAGQNVAAGTSPSTDEFHLKRRWMGNALTPAGDRLCGRQQQQQQQQSSSSSSSVSASNQRTAIFALPVVPARINEDFELACVQESPMRRWGVRNREGQSRARVCGGVFQGRGPSVLSRAGASCWSELSSLLSFVRASIPGKRRTPLELRSSRVKGGFISRFLSNAQSNTQPSSYPGPYRLLSRRHTSPWATHTHNQHALLGVGRPLGVGHNDKG
jgi:hypothetical protein